MIRIRILSDKTKKQDILAFDIKGHADYADKGQDIVCAAVSALGQTAILALTQLTDLEVEYKIQEDLPFLFCKVNLPQDDRDTDTIRAKAIMDSFEIGCRSIEEAYGPDYVKISFVSDLLRRS